VTLAHRYLAGVAIVAAGGAGAVLAVPAADRVEVGLGVLIGLLLQAPLGWWALRSLGTEQFMLVWGLGMLFRFTVLALAGLAVLPVLGVQPGPTLLAMVGILVALLLVEGAAAVRQHSREDER
jgi:heme A synthase